MANIICLIFGMIVTALYFVMLIKGKKYTELLESVDEKEFPMKEFFGIGFAWEYMIPGLSYTGKIANKIRFDVTILYGEKYCEYYCRIIMAQVYTYVHICVCFFALLAGFISDVSCLLILVIGVVLGIAVGKYYLKQPQEKLKKRAEECIQQFPNMVTKLALMINSGMILREAWYSVAENTEGELQRLMKKACELMDNGYSDADAIYQFGVNSNSKEIKKFSGSLIQGIDKGNSELAGILVQQSSELWETKRQLLLQKGETAATKLVIPTTLMFAGLIMVIVSSALSGFSV